jgi:hypothetical protein
VFSRIFPLYSHYHYQWRSRDRNKHASPHVWALFHDSFLLESCLGLALIISLWINIYLSLQTWCPQHWDGWNHRQQCSSAKCAMLGCVKICGETPPHALSSWLGKLPPHTTITTALSNIPLTCPQPKHSKYIYPSSFFYLLWKTNLKLNTKQTLPIYQMLSCPLVPTLLSLYIWVIKIGKNPK